MANESLYSGSCSKHSVDTIVSNVLFSKGKSFVFDTIVTLFAFITSFPLYSQFSNKKRLFPLISPEPTSKTRFPIKKLGSIFLQTK